MCPLNYLRIILCTELLFIMVIGGDILIPVYGYYVLLIMEINIINNNNAAVLYPPFSFIPVAERPEAKDLFSIKD